MYIYIYTYIYIYNVLYIYIQLYLRDSWGKNQAFCLRFSPTPTPPRLGRRRRRRRRRGLDLRLKAVQQLRLAERTSQVESAEIPAEEIPYDSDESWWIMMNHDDSWWIMMTHDESWWIMMNHDEPWWIMMNPDESWWIMMNHQLHPISILFWEHSEDSSQVEHVLILLGVPGDERIIFLKKIRR